MTKRNGKHAALSMTLRQAYDRYYDRTELAPRSISQAGHNLKRWESLTGDPPISKIDEALLEEFRQAALKKWSPASINATRTQLRAVLRRLGPQFTGNPTGLCILERVPYMKPCKVIREIPRRVSQEDLSRWYIAAASATHPRWGGLPGARWQCWATIAYFCGLRKSDIFSLRFADFDFDAGTLTVTAQKTRKPGAFPLHPCVVEHVQRITGPRELLFQGRFHASGDFNTRWNDICDRAKVERFTPHDVRRTCGSEAERAKPGMGPVILQHRFIDVSHVSYLNQAEELGETIAKMRVPIAFGHGIKQAERQLEKQRRENAELMKSARFAAVTFPNVEEWQFTPNGFSIRGRFCSLKGARLVVLKTIAEAREQPVDYETLCRAMWPDGNRPANHRTRHGKVCFAISVLRDRLRRTLYLPPEFDPCPCISRTRGGVWGGKWTIWLPGEPVGNQKPMQRLTIREACDRLYVVHIRGLSAGTVRVMQTACDRWAQWSRNAAIEDITRDDFIIFRRRAQSTGLATRTVESYIDKVQTILKHCAKTGALDHVPVRGGAA